MSIPTRVCAATAALPLLAACESPQDPEPIGKTLPTAAGIVGMWSAVTITILYFSIRWIARQRERALVDSPIAVALLVIVPVVLASTPIVLGLAWIVAFGYTEPTTSLFSWEDTVGVHAVVAGASGAMIAAAAAIALLAAHGDRVVVAIGQVLLAVPAGTVIASLVASDPSLASLLGLLGAAPWAAAFVLTWRQSAAVATNRADRTPPAPPSATTITGDRYRRR